MKTKELWNADKLAVALRILFGALITATIAVLFGALGWMISLVVSGMTRDPLASTVVSYALPCLFGLVGAVIGARTLLTHI